MRYTVLLVDGDDRARWELCAYANRQESLQIIAQASTYKMVNELLAINKFDVVLVDIDLADRKGLEVINRIREEFSDTKCLVASNNNGKEAVLEALRSGADGYVIKDGKPETICEAVLQVMSGGSPISPCIAHHLLDHFRVGKANVEVKNDAKLTKRESEVLQLIAKGYSYTEIAEALSLSYHTISTYIKIIYNKLSVCSRGEAVYEAIRCGLIHVNRSQAV